MAHGQLMRCCVILTSYVDTSAPQQRTELLVGGLVQLRSGAECPSKCLFGLDCSVSCYISVADFKWQRLLYI